MPACNSGYTQTCQLVGSPCQLLNQHAASRLSRPREMESSISPSRPPDLHAKPLKLCPDVLEPDEARGESSL